MAKAKKSVDSEKTTSSEAKEVKKPRKSAAVKQDEKWMDLMSHSNKNSAKYNLKKRFDLNDVIDHPKFGPGIVVRYQGEQKIEVAFRDVTRLLMHNL